MYTYNDMGIPKSIVAIGTRNCISQCTYIQHVHIMYIHNTTCAYYVYT